MEKQTETQLFETFEEFAKFVGLLGENADWESIGIIPDNGSYFSTDRLQELRDFVSKNPEYHIVTLTSDGDDDNSTTFDNTIRFVNRIEYCLANGSKENAFLSEPSEPSEE